MTRVILTSLQVAETSIGETDQAQSFDPRRMNEGRMALRTMTTHACSWIPLLMASFSLGSLSCMSDGPAGREPAGAAGAESRVEAAVRAWFAALELQPQEPDAIERFLGTSGVEFSLSDKGSPGPSALRDWVLDLRSSHSQVTYRLDALRIESVDVAEYRARFEVDRRALDGAGVPHVARSQQAWLIRALPGVIPVVHRIDEQRLLAFPGTGPQIVCY